MRSMSAGSPSVRTQRTMASRTDAPATACTAIYSASLTNRSRTDLRGRQRSGQRLVLAKDFLTTLRDRELADVGKALAEDTGLTYRPAVDGQRISSIYRRFVPLAS